ncbi:hypothetical protein PF004_g5471 [Phytophthora fragariae]|uniref:Shugoshin C-terminal domain-containing protein n=1 Tax=Phytophthora fragariae TaxID=53985 RepID=A0A6G0PFX5_9STRA|nr:hypothetical protein PF004_g5471 [Phytophthora fragariae]
MVQGTSTARALSIMQELQQLRDMVGGISEKNRQLAKALTATRQELTRARAAQTAVFSNKVFEWMDARHKPVEVRHQATQCNFEEPDQRTRAFVEDMRLEPEPPLSPCRSHIAEQELGVPSLAKSANSVERGKIIVQDREESADDDSSSRELAIASGDTRPNSTTVDSEDSNFKGSRETQALQLQTKRSLHMGPGSSSQTGASRRLRRRDAGVSYAEPKLNTKLRRGDYYGLGKRTGQQVKSHRHHRPPKHRVISEPRRATFVTSPFGQQRSPFRRHTTRPVQRVSYAEPKLNTKLRQGDKFTFTT